MALETDGVGKALEAAAADIHGSIRGTDYVIDARETRVGTWVGGLESEERAVGKGGVLQQPCSYRGRRAAPPEPRIPPIETSGTAVEMERKRGAARVEEGASARIPDPRTVCSGDDVHGPREQAGRR